MKNLPELQKEFINFLTQQNAPAPAHIVSDNHFSAEQRLQVYKNNTQFILRDLLKDVFPVTTKLLGEGFMHYAAAAFIAAHPPKSGDMNGYGAAFPAFLKSLPQMEKFPFVPDMAELEWARHEVYLSADKTVLISSDWSIFDLWKNITAGKEPASLRLEKCAVAVYREGLRVVVQLLTAAASLG